MFRGHEEWKGRLETTENLSRAFEATGSHPRALRVGERHDDEEPTVLRLG